ncbi:NUDIX hydrolase [Deinococcus cellulosilyticus]|uniref:8-oxo-dGTP diphosphatase n=1 Tax=Deinococcus cellulosilyticus (strain DSM 18568 / NBRC 106333 / KACC 11606 / 5516J-15) TaxID=1223518 RepID=A0A511NCF6_DEIC1|nr:NUDIX domain-containing protein [Deinococcus cellulosilyticus]GEM50188.1 8-oxo-dGTP diphosphatase [Deinococcus cellulosilyticus NBRC 106333 = KACC 11606]
MKRERFKAPSSVFLILHSQQKFCLLHRTHTGWMDGLYSIAAGAVEAGETLIQALIREAKEELGITVLPQHLQLVHTLHAKTEGDLWLGHFFAAQEWDGEPITMEPHKHSHILWVPLDEVNGQLVPYVEQALRAVQAGQMYSEFGFEFA